MFIEQIIHSSAPKIENPKNAMDNYLRIGVLAMNDVASYIHARRRSDMKEVYIWLYKTPLRQLSEKEHFTNTLVQYSKLKNSPLLSYGVDQNGYAYVVTDKIKLFSINNSKTIDLASTFYLITKEVHQAQTKNIFHGAYSDFSFGITDDDVFILSEPIGININKSVSPEDDIYSLGALFFHIATRNKLPKFESNIEHSHFLNYGLNAKLNSAKCPENLALIIKKALDPNLRFNNTQELLHELKKQLTVENRHITDSQIFESTSQILDSTILTIKENIFNFNSLSDLNYKQNPTLFNGALIAAITIMVSLLFIGNIKFKSIEKYSINESTSKQGLEIIKNNLFKKGSINNDNANYSYRKHDLIKAVNPSKNEKIAQSQSDTIKLKTEKLPYGNIKTSNKQEQTISLSRIYFYRFDPQSELQKLLIIEKQKELCLNK